ncbi:hypothetical protein ACFOWX_07910 [Sphingorhabdus arenilitoris]|uniref:Helix-turn-helix domain-containing protein n=1 Tax=Sphingorhabdus arenilitoris TaxID=1490041 RepID=A0ABV8RG15_9SPHN
MKIDDKSNQPLPRWRQFAAKEQVVFTPDKEDIPFIPVAMERKRASGWTADRQRLFIRHLQHIGIVAAAARAAGMSPKSAHALKKRGHMQRYLSGEAPPQWDAERLDFTQAWDLAVKMGRDNAYSHAIARALQGETLIIRKEGGVRIIEKRRYDNRLLARALAPLPPAPPKSAR